MGYFRCNYCDSVRTAGISKIDNCKKCGNMYCMDDECIHKHPCELPYHNSDEDDDDYDDDFQLILNRN
jgi:hypothetical protein